MPDGIHWVEMGQNSRCGDNTTFFYNPFRSQWVFSLRKKMIPEGGRDRAYYENVNFADAGRWPSEAPVFWARADRLDRPDPSLIDKPQLYDVNAVAYESIMLSLHAIFFGHQNEVCRKTGDPKNNELFAGFSRDGFHFDRPSRIPLISASRRTDAWDRGYLHAAGGICLVVDDNLYFYYGAWSGVSPRLQPGEMGSHDGAWKMYSGGSTGLAVLRRDGFASMGAGAHEATLMTRLLRFSGKYLFVNVDAPKGLLFVEVCSERGEPLAGFTKSDCVPIAVDSTKMMVSWRSGNRINCFAGKPVRFRFFLTEGDLYAFWVSSSPKGESGGYVAGGGPEFTGGKDG